MNEIKNINLWTRFQQKIIYQELWHHPSKKSCTYKIDKQEDLFRRKFYLKVIKNRKQKQYLSEIKYKEKLYSLAKKSNFNSDVSEDESFDNKSLEIIKCNFKNKESGFSSFRDSLYSMFNSQRKSKGNWSIANNFFEEHKTKEEENHVITQNKKKNRHFLLNDRNDNKEVVMHKKPKNECIEKNSLMEYKYKCFCEKISLEGAIWGQLILLKNSVIFFSLNEGRPKDDPIFRSIFILLKNKQKKIKIHIYFKALVF